MTDKTLCPKCGFSSGDDWKQCKGSCPMPQSPYFNPPVARNWADHVAEALPPGALGRNPHVLREHFIMPRNLHTELAHDLHAAYHAGLRAGQDLSKAELERSISRECQLKEALEPFAHYSDAIFEDEGFKPEDHEPINEVPLWRHKPAALTVADFKRVRAVLGNI